MEPNNSVMAGLKLEIDVAEDPQGNCAYSYTDDDRRCRGSADHSGSKQAAVSEQLSGAGLGMFGLKVKLKTETPDPDPDLAEAEDPFIAFNLQVKKEPVSGTDEDPSTTLNIQVKKEPVSNSGDETSDEDATGSRVPDHSGSSHAAVSEQPSGSGFRMFGLKVKLKTETPDPDLAEAEDPFMAFNSQVKKEPVSGSGDETSNNDIEDCDVSDTDWHFKFSKSDANLDNCESKTNNRKENNKVSIKNQVSKASNFSTKTSSASFKDTISDSSGVIKPKKLLSTSKKFSCQLCSSAFIKFSTLKNHVSSYHGQKYHDALAQHTGEMLTGDRSLAINLPLEEITAETQTQFTSSSVQNRQQHFDEEDTTKGVSNHQEILNECLKCNLCGKDFNWLHDIKRHRCMHTGDKPYQCKDCDKAFNSSQTLKTHQPIHMGDKPYLCTVCGKAFSQLISLKKHQRIHTGEKPYQCTDCSKAFSQLINLKTHQRFHTGDKPYLCTNCGKTFRYSHHLKRHQHLHTGDKTFKCIDKPFYCTDCGKAFSQSQHLKRHKRLHTGDKPFKCIDCDKAFNQSIDLKRHQRVHTGDKPYQCSDCGKAFSLSKHLKTHQRIHTGEKPYQCTDCDKAFNDSSNLKRHQRIHLKN